MESLKKALKKSMQAGNLDEANKIDAAIKALKQGAELKEKSETERTTKVEYWPNGKKRLEAHYKDDKLDGLATEWYENGQKSGEGHYKNGKLDGLETHWHENGQKSYEGHNKNGVPDGLWTFWDENGEAVNPLF